MSLQIACQNEKWPGGLTKRDGARRGVLPGLGKETEKIELCAGVTG